MSLTIGDIINGASDPSQAISNFVGNLQVGGRNPAPAVSTQPQQNAYQFQGNPSGPGLQMPQTTPAAPAPVAPVAPAAPAPVAPVAPAVSALPQAMQMPSTQPMAPTNYNPAPSAPPQAVPAMNINELQSQPATLPQQTQQIQNAGLTNEPSAPVTGAAPVNPYQAIPTPVTQPQPPQPQMAGPGLQPNAQSQAVFDDPLNHFIQNQNNPKAMANLAYGGDTHPLIRAASATQAGETIQHRNNMDKAQEQVENAIQNKDQDALAKIIAQRNSDKGSYLKAYLFHRFGMNDLAAEEQEKLGAGKKWVSAVGPGGERAAIQISRDGLPLQGIGQNGQSLKSNDLVNYATGGAGVKAHVGLGNVINSQMKDEQGNAIAGRVVTREINGITNTFVESNGKMYPYSSAWKPQSELSAGAKINMNLTAQLQRLHGANVFKAEQQYEKENGPFASEADRQEFRQLYGSIPGQTSPGSQKVEEAPTGAPAAGAPASAMPPAPTPSAPASAMPPAPTPSAPAPVSNPNLRIPISQLQNANKTNQQLTAAQGKADIALRKELAVAEGKVPIEINKAQQLAPIKSQEKVGAASAATVAAAGKAEDTIANAEDTIKLINTGKHNIGPLVSGTLGGGGPIGQAIGTQFNTDAARNTQTIMNTVRDIGAAAAQGTIKGHLTNQELSFITNNKPTERSDPAYVKQYLEKSIKSIQRAQQAAQNQVNTGGSAPNPALNRGTPGTRENPIKLD